MWPSGPAEASCAAPPVSFGTAVRRGLTDWTFGGRASRSEFWWFTLLVAAALVVLAGVGELQAGLEPGGVADAITVVGLLPMMVIFLSLVKVGVRRYHDTGRSGALFVVHFFGPPVGMIAAVFGYLVSIRESGTSATVGAVVLLGSLLLAPVLAMWMLVILCLPGRHERNRFDTPATPPPGDERVPFV